MDLSRFLPLRVPFLVIFRMSDDSESLLLSASESEVLSVREKRFLKDSTLDIRLLSLLHCGSGDTLGVGVHWRRRPDVTDNNSEESLRLILSHFWPTLLPQVARPSYTMKN